MSKFIEYFLNWWVSRPANIFFGDETVYIRPEHWLELSWVMFLGLTIAPIIISIIVCYTLTNSMGKKFLIRWWIFMIITSVFNFVLIYFFLSSKIFVAGMIDAPVYWTIPTFMVIGRALVGLAQSILFYYLISIILVKILGGIFRSRKFNVNLAYPFPRFINA